MLYGSISNDNEFSTWLEEPDRFENFILKSNECYCSGKPYDVVIGVMRSGEEILQGFKYQTRFWTKNQAKKHCIENDGVNFLTANVRKKYTDFRKIPQKIKRFPRDAQLLWLFSYNKMFGKNSNALKAEKFAKDSVMFFFTKKDGNVVLKEKFNNKPIESLIFVMKGFKNE